VDDVVAEDQRDLQPAVLDRELLCLACRLRPGHVQHRSDEPASDLLVGHLLSARARCRAGHVERAAVLIELPDLLFERHPREECVDLLLGRGIHQSLRDAVTRNEYERQQDGSEESS
jgi:hypothetical protein